MHQLSEAQVAQGIWPLLHSAPTFAVLGSRSAANVAGRLTGPRATIE
jgi:hypothetical protein